MTSNDPPIDASVGLEPDSSASSDTRWQRVLAFVERVLRDGPAAVRAPELAAHVLDVRAVARAVAAGAPPLAWQPPAQWSELDRLTRAAQLIWSRHAGRCCDVWLAPYATAGVPLYAESVGTSDADARPLSHLVISEAMPRACGGATPEAALIYAVSYGVWLVRRDHGLEDWSTREAVDLLRDAGYDLLPAEQFLDVLDPTRTKGC